jgi:urease accessory protein
VPSGSLLYLLQIMGGTFPTGAFAHSLGFETLISDGDLTAFSDIYETVVDWLRFGLAPVDGAAVALAHRAAMDDDFDEVLSLDEMLGALKPAREAYEASVKLGRAFVRTASAALPGPELTRYAAAISAGRADGHGAVAVALSCVDHAVVRREAVLAYLYGGFSNLVLVVARLIPLGQTEVQNILSRARPEIAECAEMVIGFTKADICSTTAFLDIGAMRHERLYTRLCIS